MAAGDLIVGTLTTLGASAINATTNLTTALTANAGTADTDGLLQSYTFKPTKANSKGLLFCKLGTAGTAAADLPWSITAGAGGLAAAATTGTLVKEQLSVILVDGRYIDATGKFTITFDPGGSDKIVTDFALSVAYIELP